MKLVIYMCFFAMLLLFHGIPIHIIRDVYLTMRSFLKRISDFQKYRNATRDMNARYPDATAQELERDGTCIICREDMRPWLQPGTEPTTPRRPGQAPPDERQRPKKLPCGHILHLACLKSWLERQQVCPTCRTSVLARDQSRGTAGAANQPAVARGNFIQGVPPGNNGAAPGPHNNNPQPPNNNQAVRARQFRLGPWRFTFAAGEAGQIRDTLRQLNQRQPAANQAQINGGNAADQANLTGINPSSSPTGSIHQRLHDLERSIMQEIQQLNVSSEQLQGVRRLQSELMRLRLQQDLTRTGPIQHQHQHQYPSFVPPLPQIPQIPQYQIPPTQRPYHAWQPTMVPPQFVPNPYQQPPAFGTGAASYGSPLQFQGGPLPPPGFVTSQHTTSFGPGHPNLPAGLTLPEGWSAVPLHRIGAGRQGLGQPTEPHDPFDFLLPVVLRQTAERAPSLQQNSDAPAPQAAQTEPPTMPGPTVSNGDAGSHSLEPSRQEEASSSSVNNTRETTETPPENSQVPNWSSSSEQTTGTPIIVDQPAEGSSSASGAQPPEKGKSHAARVEDTEDGNDEDEDAAALQIP